MVKTASTNWNTREEKEKVFNFLIYLATDADLIKRFQVEKNRRAILEEYEIHEEYIKVILAGDTDELYRMLGEGEKLIVT